jgi:hypothetical protein
MLLGIVTSIAVACGPVGGNKGLADLGGQFGVGNVGETLKYVRKLDFEIASVGESVYVARFPCATCPDSAVRLMFVPEKRAHKVKWDDAFTSGKPGHVIATVINVDGYPFPELGLEPGKFAYAWIGQVSSNPADRGFAVYRMNDSTGAREAGPWMLQGSASWCKYTQARDKPRIKEKNTHDCDTTKVLGSNTAVLPVGGGIVRFASNARVTSSAPGGSMWISCSGGCCQIAAD